VLINKFPSENEVPASSKYVDKQEGNKEEKDRITD